MNDECEDSASSFILPPSSVGKGRRLAVIKYTSSPTNQRKAVYFERNPSPIATPTSAHAHRLPSKIARLAKYVANPQKKNINGSVVISTLPAMNSGTMWNSSTVPSASRSEPNSFRVSRYVTSDVAAPRTSAG